jgi:hypothetical protein
VLALSRPFHPSLSFPDSFRSQLQNCGTTIMTVSAGAIQDRAADDKNQYRFVFAFIIGSSFSHLSPSVKLTTPTTAVKAIDVIYGLFYWAWDVKYLNGVLKANDKELRRKEAEIPHEILYGGQRAPIRSFTIFGLTTVVSAIITSWVLYWVYSV